MRKIQTLILLTAAVFLISSVFASRQSDAQTGRPDPVKKTTLTGQIAKSRHGYVIRSRRGNAPSEIFTIRNPVPKMLDDLVSSQKTVSIEVRIITGDNVKIEKIDGREYLHDGP